MERGHLPIIGNNIYNQDVILPIVIINRIHAKLSIILELRAIITNSRNGFNQLSGPTGAHSILKARCHL